jgi:hypothetical protein
LFSLDDGGGERVEFLMEFSWSVASITFYLRCYGPIVCVIENLG